MCNGKENHQTSLNTDKSKDHKTAYNMGIAGKWGWTSKLQPITNPSCGSDWTNNYGP